MRRTIGPRTEEASALLRLFVVFALALVVCAIVAPELLSHNGVILILVSFTVEVALVTLGQSLVIITGGVDLSISGVVSLTGVTVGALAHHGLPTAALVPLGILVGLTCGLLVGIVVAYVGAPPIMATLGAGILFAGIALGLTGGSAFSVFPKTFSLLGQGKAGIPNQILLLAVVAVAVIVIADRTRFGRWAYATGANLPAARLSGIPVRGVLVGVYMASGLLASLAGMIMAARVNSAVATMGAGLVLASITAAVIGGISVFGGKGSLFGALLGVLTISMLQGAMTLNGVGTEDQSMAIAFLLLCVLLLGRVSLPALARRLTAGSPDVVGPAAAASSRVGRDDVVR